MGLGEWLNEFSIKRLSLLSAMALFRLGILKKAARAWIGLAHGNDRLFTSEAFNHFFLTIRQGLKPRLPKSH